MGAERLGHPAAELEAVNGEVRPKSGGPGVGFGALIGNRRFGLKLDPKPPLKAPASYTIVGKPLPRPDVPAKVTGTHTYVHDFKLPGMMHARVIRHALGRCHAYRGRRCVDPRYSRRADRAPQGFSRGRRRRRMERGPRRCALSRRSGRKPRPPPTTMACATGCAPGRSPLTRRSAKKATHRRPIAASTPRLEGTYYWPLQTHGSMGPSCAVADVRDGKATVWTCFAGDASPAPDLRANPRTAAVQCPRHLSRRCRLLRHERPRRCLGRCRADVQGDRPAGARAMDRARTSMAGTPRARRNCSSLRSRARRRRQDRRVAHRDVAAEGDRESAQHSAARARSGRHCPAARAFRPG